MLQGACPGEYDLSYGQVWPKVPSVTIKPPRRQSKREALEPKRVMPMLDLYGAADSDKMNKVPKFDMMAARRPFINYPSYKEQDSEEEERKRMEEHIKNYCRPPSVMAKSTD